MNSRKWMLLAVISFCIVAIGVKEINANISAIQIIFFRSFIGLILLFAVFKKKIQGITFKKIKIHLLRNIFHLLGQYGWVLGLVYLSLTEVTAIEFTVPIWVILFAALYLNEKMTRWKIVSVLICFLGVLVIIRPGFEIFNINTIIVLLSAVSYAIAHIFTKKIVKTESPLDIIIIMCITQTPIAFVLSLNNWNYPNLPDLFWLIIIAIAAISAHFSLAKAFKETNIGEIITLDYLRLPILSFIGIMIYKEDFDLLLLSGALLIIIGNYINLKKVQYIKHTGQLKIKK
jgi:drug/metabolite transporter (DMT)-like permease